MSLFATGGPTSPQLCERFADEIAMLDEPGSETSSRIAARTHLAGCHRCQQERHAMLEIDAALRRRVQTRMAQAPIFTEVEIAAKATMRIYDAKTKQQASRRHEVAKLRGRLGREAAMGKTIAPSRAAPVMPFWRRALSTGGSVAAAVLITALLVVTLTGHLPGLTSSTRPGVNAPTTTPVPLSTLRVYAPGPHTAGTVSSIVAYRASDGAPESPAPVATVAQWGTVFSQGVRYQLTMPDTDVSPTAVIPATLSATRIQDGQSLWSERIDPIYTPDLVLVDGVLYLGTRLMGIMGVDPHIMAVYAFRASDGARLWRQALTDQPNGPPVVSHGVVYVVAGDTVLALRADDGRTLWQTKLETGGRQIMSAWSTAASGALYAYISLESPTGQKDSFGVDVFALRLTDGETLWHVDLGTDIFPAAGPFAPVIADGIVYVRLATVKFTSPVVTLRLFALRATDGATLWRYTSTHTENGNVGIPNIYPPAVSNGIAYVTEDGGNLTALDTRDGHILWRVNVDTTTSNDAYPFSITSPLAVDGAVFVVVNDWVVAVRASDGGTLWRAACGGVHALMNYQAYHLVVGP